eukprot:g33580.t1
MYNHGWPRESIGLIESDCDKRIDKYVSRIWATVETPEVEYEVLLLQFAGGDIVAQEKAQDGHVIQGVGRGIRMVGERKVLSFVAYRAQMLYETVSESTLCLTDVEEATLGAADTIDQVAEVAEIDTLDEEVGGVICEDKEDSVFIFVDGGGLRAE